HPADSLRGIARTTERTRLERVAGIDRKEPEIPPSTVIPADSHGDSWQIDRLQFHLDEPNLPVWRACPDLPRYAEIVPRRRRQITHLLRLLDGFARRPFSQVSGLLVAPPGSGKSHLIECAASFLHLRKHEINLSQMQSFAELREEFDRLAAIMSTTDGPHLVFIDEVNAPIEGQLAYGAFLTLLQQQEGRRRGLTMKLGPVAWIFAGTDLLADETMWEELDGWLSRASSFDGSKVEDLEWRTREKRGLPPTMRAGRDNSWSDYAATKAPDFVSRLDLRRITLNI